jgi:uncharacterized protein (DUF2267 family)
MVITIHEKNIPSWTAGRPTRTPLIQIKALAVLRYYRSNRTISMSTGLDTFDKTVQESNLWLKDVMERLDTTDRHHAYSTLRAVLHALRDRIGPESAAHLGAQLPMLLRGLFYEGWDPTGKPSKERHEADFLAHIARGIPRADAAEVEQGVRAAFDVLSKRIDRGTAVKLASMFPLELRKFWPAFVQDAARERQAGVP